MDEKLKISHKIRLLLRLRGFSLKELSARSKVPYTALSAIQNDNLIPSLEKLINISDACGVHPIYWIENVKPDICILMMEKLPTALSLAKLPQIVCKHLEHGIRSMKNLDDVSTELPIATNIGKMEISEKYYAYADGEEWKNVSVGRGGEGKGKAAAQRNRNKSA
jgi:transcriptional regulator with XRE-family HTH domain